MVDYLACLCHDRSLFVVSLIITAIFKFHYKSNISVSMSWEKKEGLGNEERVYSGVGVGRMGKRVKNPPRFLYTQRTKTSKCTLNQQIVCMSG